MYVYMYVCVTTAVCMYVCMYVCMHVWPITYSKSKDQPGKVANPARGELNKEHVQFHGAVCSVTLGRPIRHGLPKFLFCHAKGWPPGSG